MFGPAAVTPVSPVLPFSAQCRQQTKPGVRLGGHFGGKAFFSSGTTRKRRTSCTWRRWTTQRPAPVSNPGRYASVCLAWKVLLERFQGIMKMFEYTSIRKEDTKAVPFSPAKRLRTASQRSKLLLDQPSPSSSRVSLQRSYSRHQKTPRRKSVRLSEGKQLPVDSESTPGEEEDRREREDTSSIPARRRLEFASTTSFSRCIR